MGVRHFVQGACLALFIVLLWFTAMPVPAVLDVTAFAQLDPALVLGAALAAKTVAAIGLPLLLLLAATAVLGRFFCSHVCPLGTTLDMVKPLAGRTTSGFKPPASWRKGKYLFLALLGFAALYGANFTHFGTPISLAVRLYALVLRPAAKFLLAPLSPAAHSASNFIGVPELYESLSIVRYSGLLLLVPFLFAVIFLVRYAPRFWCRYLCPSGAIFALVGARPLIRRMVSDDCNACGKCAKRCPVGAIDLEDPKLTVHPECIACRTCVNVCPEGAVTFNAARERGARTALADTSKRHLFGAATAGLLWAFIAKNGISGARTDESPLDMVDTLVRPPGALPEPGFLALCTRCSLCIKACPTNMLQPGIFQAGLDGLFAPVAASRIGPCEPLCNACGQVCPTRAIRPLTMGEKPWAKMGTAVILRRKCLAWEMDKACLVCDEACPYDAIKLVQEPGIKVAVPVVDESRCSGCGYCENKCPVTGESAIRITPMGALRLEERESYPERAKQAGLSIQRTADRAPEEAAPQEFQGLPPGFED
jgi:MauM/NapG family ferredoxin protein